MWAKIGLGSCDSGLGVDRGWSRSALGPQWESLPPLYTQSVTHLANTKPG